MKIYDYVLYALMLVTIGFVYTHMKSFSEPTDEELIQKFAFPRSGGDLSSFRPKIWIAVPSMKNRGRTSILESGPIKEKNRTAFFESGDVTPDTGLALILQSIIRHNRADFQICLVDDESYSALIPGWAEKGISVARAPGAMRTQLREIALLNLLYEFGGIVLPPSFLCFESLKPAYDKYTEGGTVPFFGEMYHPVAKFIPGTRIMGAAPKNYFVEQTIQERINAFMPPEPMTEPGQIMPGHVTVKFPKKLEDLRSMMDMHYDAPATFNAPFLTSWLKRAVESREANLVPAEVLGRAAPHPILEGKRDAIDLDEWMESSPTAEGRIEDLVVSRQMIGVDFPHEELKKRRAFEWFSNSTPEKVIAQSAIFILYLRISLTDKEAANLTLIKSDGAI